MKALSSKYYLIALILAGIIAYCISEIPGYYINQNRKMLRYLFESGQYSELRRFSQDLSRQVEYQNDIAEWEGRILLEEKQYLKAIKIFEKLADNYPRRYAWWIGFNRIALARAYFGAGKTEEARRELDAAMMMTEAPQVVHQARINAYEFGFLKTSGMTAGKDENPGPDSIPDELWSLYQKDDLSELERSYQIHSQNPQYQDAINHLRGRVLVENWEFAEAIPYLEPLIDGNQRTDWLRGYSCLYLARAYFGSNRRKEARETLEAGKKISSLPKLANETQNLIIRMGFLPEFQAWPVIESENLVCHFSPEFSESEQNEYIASHEQAFSEIQNVFIASLPRKIDIYAWYTKEEAAQMGLPILSFARADLCSVYVHRNASIGHEMTHIVCRYGPGSKARNPFLMEGTAVCFDQTGENKLEKAAAHIIEKKMSTPTVEQLWRSMKGTSDLVAYPFAGCFFHRLLDSFGAESIRALFQTNGNWENAKQLYGQKLLLLSEDFQSDLAKEITRQKQR